jgi:hypothetical protein
VPKLTLEIRSPWQEAGIGNALPLTRRVTGPLCGANLRKAPALPEDIYLLDATNHNWLRGADW